MISKRKLRDRMQRSADESFSTPSSTLMERLPEMAKASAETSSLGFVRAGRRIAGTLASIGLIGWLTMGGAGALITVAAVGDLPDPVQQFVADVVHVVGIDLPSPTQEKIEKQQNPVNSSTNGSGTTGGSTPRSSSSTPAVSDDPGANGSPVPGGPGGPGGASGPSTTTTAPSRPTTTTKSPTTTTAKPPSSTTTKPGNQTQGDGSRQTNAFESWSTDDSFSRSERDD
ncbi:MAG: hypothetical protein F2920_06360 [Actinobacteria bacterium]|uniref:Unannotated protein n=1 Tax=freshwater metagenome TaxID=449393 RepID=A0A6J6APD9_9ZZZZ|nr:hypothetical protein [Actinomycetota bacterium]MTB23273.1 hypothetical protein [Actinomycetota bacterium]